MEEVRVMDMIDNVLVDDIERLTELSYQDEDDAKVRNKWLSEICKLSEIRANAEKIYQESLVQHEHNDVERERNEASAKNEERKTENMLKVEQEKQKISWKKAALEIGKVAIPVVLSGVAYGVFQGRLIKLEEKGTRMGVECPTAGRELHLPNIFKW